MMVPWDRIGAPGVPGHLIVSAVFSDNRYEGKDRLNDLTPRSFQVRARLSRHTSDQLSIAGDINPDQGSSFFLLAEGKSHIEMESSPSVLRFDHNARRELSTVSSDIEATSAQGARLSFEQALAVCIDRLSFVYAVPIFVQMTTVRDVENEVQYIFFRSPPRSTQLSHHEEKLYVEMQPIYALYREFQNSWSPYYRVLTLYKIMEGLLGTLRMSVQRRAKERGRQVHTPKAIVPDHTDLAASLKPHAGEPMKKFFDGFLTKRYRDAVAHFELRERSALNVSSIPDSARFEEVAFLADLCVRALIVRHEASLQQLYSPN